MMVLKYIKNYSRYHNVLRRSKWSGTTGAKILLGLLLALLPDNFPIIVAVDETPERQRGRKTNTKGMFRDDVIPIKVDDAQPTRRRDKSMVKMKSEATVQTMLCLMGTL